MHRLHRGGSICDCPLLPGQLSASPPTQMLRLPLTTPGAPGSSRLPSLACSGLVPTQSPSGSPSWAFLPALARPLPTKATYLGLPLPWQELQSSLEAHSVAWSDTQTSHSHVTTARAGRPGWRRQRAGRWPWPAVGVRFLSQHPCGQQGCQTSLPRDILLAQHPLAACSGRGSLE